MSAQANERALTLSRLRGMTGKGLSKATRNLQAGSPSADALRRVKAFKHQLNRIPAQVCIFVDRSGSGDNDLPEFEAGIEIIKQTVGEDDCKIMYFGDACLSPQYNGLAPGGRLVNHSLTGGSNRHEGGVQAMYKYMQDKGWLQDRSTESPPVEVYLYTDEYPDGSLDGFELGSDVRENYKVSEGSKPSEKLAAIMDEFRAANIHLHILTPEKNDTDYRYDVIKYLGIVWQALAARAGGDWTNLNNMDHAFVRAAQKMQVDLVRLSQSLTREVQLLLGDGKRVREV